MTTECRSRFAERHWYRFSLLSVLLLPLAVLFGAGAALRRLLYRTLLRAVHLPVPVVVVGNLVVGGTGKTPLVLWMVRYLRERGRRPGIVLRGYGGQTDAPRSVGAADDAREAGDEAVLLAQRSDCPVWTGRDRVAAGQALLHAHPECDVIVCDDGLQHYRLARDIEIAVEDERGHGNGLLLPAGPLREPSCRRVDATVVNGDARPARAGPVFHMGMAALGFQRLDGRPVEAGSLAGKRLHAVAGTGNPGRFFQMLRAMGLAVRTHAFPDHHTYSNADLDFAECDMVILTEKDAVKCRSFGRDDLVMLRIGAEPEPAFADFLQNALNGRTIA